MGAGFILSSAIGSGIICGIWTGISMAFAGPLIATWVGFVGCTSYFSSGFGRNGFIRSLCSNYMGVLIGCTIIYLGTNISGSVLFNTVCTGFFTAVICYLAHFDLTRLVPCTFMGGYSAFASGGNWKMLLICLFLGNIVGILSDYTGRYIYQKFFQREDGKADWVAGKVLQD